METYLNIALIIISVLLIVSVIMQSKGGAGLGGLTGGDTGAVFTARRGIERTLFRLTIVLSALFFLLVLILVYIAG
jgi:preprotein translocase subunit SecG